MDLNILRAITQRNPLACDSCLLKFRVSKLDKRDAGNTDSVSKRKSLPAVAKYVGSGIIAVIIGFLVGRFTMTDSGLPKVPTADKFSSTRPSKHKNRVNLDNVRQDVEDATAPLVSGVSGSMSTPRKMSLK